MTYLQHISWNDDRLRAPEECQEAMQDKKYLLDGEFLSILGVPKEVNLMKEHNISFGKTFTYRPVSNSVHMIR